jgi:hypothetical protein
MGMRARRQATFVTVYVPSCLGPVGIGYQNQFAMGLVLFLEAVINDRIS